MAKGISKELRRKMEESHKNRLALGPMHAEVLYWPVHIKKAKAPDKFILHYPQIKGSGTGPFSSKEKAAEWYIRNGR